MRLNRTPSPQYLSTPSEGLSPLPATRLVPLTTKYFSPKSSTELPGWRESFSESNSQLEIAAQKPFVVKTKGQWTSQPRYPHYKHTRNVSMPTLPKPKPRNGLLKIPLNPCVSEIPQISEQEFPEDEGKLYLPPIRHLDNRSSHHEHPGTAFSELRLSRDSDVFTQIKPRARPKPAPKPLHVTHNPAPSLIPADPVLPRTPAPITASVETSRSPICERSFFTPFRKPLSIPERLIRKAKDIRKAPEAPADLVIEETEDELGSGIVITAEDVLESGDSVLFRYSEESEEIGQFDNRTRGGSYIGSEVVTSAGQSPKQGQPERRRYKEVTKIHRRSTSQRKLTEAHATEDSHTEEKQHPASRDSHRQTDSTPALSLACSKKSVGTDTVSHLSDLLPGPATPVLINLPHSPSSELHFLDDPQGERFATNEDIYERTDDQDPLESDPRLSLSPRKESLAGMSTLSTLQETKTGKATLDDPSFDIERPIEEEKAGETIIEEIEEIPDAVFMSPVLTQRQEIEAIGHTPLPLPEPYVQSPGKPAHSIQILPVTVSPRPESSSSLSSSPLPKSIDTPGIDGESKLIDHQSDFSLVKHVIVEELSGNDSSESLQDEDKASDAQVSSLRQSPRGGNLEPSPVESELQMNRKDSNMEKVRADGMAKLSPPRKNSTDVVTTLKRQISKLTDKDEKKAESKPPKSSAKKKSANKTPKRKPASFKPTPKLKLPSSSIEILPGLLIEAPQLFPNLSSTRFTLGITESDSSIASPLKVSSTSKGNLGTVGTIQSRRSSQLLSSRRQSMSSNLNTPIGTEEKKDQPQATDPPTDVFTFKEGEYANTDEVFVRQFSFALMRVILGLDSPQGKEGSELSTSKQQLETVRRKVLKVGYKPAPIDTRRVKRQSIGDAEATRITAFKSDVEAHSDTLSVVKSAAFRSRAGSINGPALIQKPKQRVSLNMKPNVMAAIHKLSPNGSEDSEDSEDDYDSSSEHNEAHRMYRMSQSLTEFELKHSSLLRNLAFNLAAKEQLPVAVVPRSKTPEDSDEEELPPIPEPVTDVWFSGHAEDLNEDVHQSIISLFRDFKDAHLNAFTSSVTNFFKDPQAAKTVDVNEATEKEEMDFDNYKESVERRKFLEYMRMLPDYQALHQGQPGVLQQISHERPHPRELRDLFRLTFLKRKIRAQLSACRNGTSPATLRAKPSFTFSGLDTKYYSRCAHRAHLSEPNLEDVILSGGAHTVSSEMIYRERVYCRMKQEPNLSKFALKGKSRRPPFSSHTSVNSPN